MNNLYAFTVQCILTIHLNIRDFSYIFLGLLLILSTNVKKTIFRFNYKLNIMLEGIHIVTGISPGLNPR